MIIIDDAAGMIKYIWEDLDIIVIGGSPLMILKMDIVDDLRKDSRDEKEQYKREARTVMRRLLKEAADTIEQLRGQVDFERECREDTYADLEKQDAEIERLRGVLLTVLEACKDVNSPDRKVREEITRTVRKALKEKE